MKRLLVCSAAALTVLAASAVAAPAMPGASWADRAYAQALQLLNSGRRAEAYGRIVALANAGHADAARFAITMCRHGLRLYGSDWDCAAAELEDWALVAGQTVAGRRAGPR